MTASASCLGNQAKRENMSAELCAEPVSVKWVTPSFDKKH